METSEYIKAKFNIGEENPGKLTGVNREELYKLFAELGYKVGCEVGLEKGKNALSMFEHIPGLKLYGVDPYVQHPNCSYEAAAQTRNWNQDYLDRIKRKAISRTKGQNITIIEKFSEDAARDFEDNSLDFVYIDADHSYDFIMQDVILWGRKVRKGGILSGHDYYYNNEKPGRRAKVTQAINDYTKVHGIKFFITDELHYEERGDYYPSWLWVKEKEIWPNVIGF